MNMCQACNVILAADFLSALSVPPIGGLGGTGCSNPDPAVSRSRVDMKPSRSGYAPTQTRADTLGHTMAAVVSSNVLPAAANRGHHCPLSPLADLSDIKELQLFNPKRSGPNFNIQLCNGTSIRNIVIVVIDPACKVCHGRC
jgi:hypothetical protein